jgi:hypothetical protein
VYKQLYAFFIENKLFYKGQYGFLKDHSTELAISEIVDRIHNHLDDGNLSLTIYLDLSKAFDMIDHDLLLNKMSSYGVNNESLLWFNSYLHDRQQFVLYQDTPSDYKFIKRGVPQGSILGPLLFLIFINDIYTCTSAFNFILFADDTTLSKSINKNITPEQLSHDINIELQKINEWLKCNKLALNTKKSKYMLFHFKQRQSNVKDLSIKINNVKIERVNNFNLLGVTIDENITWNAHVNKISNKIAKINSVLARLKNAVPLNTLKTIYTSLMLPHYNYGNTLWGKNIKRLFLLQKKAVRNICRTKYNAHTDALFKRLKLLKLEDISRLNCLKVYYKYVHNNLPWYYIDFVKESGNRYNTRQTGNVVFPRAHFTHCRNRLRFKIPQALNTTEPIVKNKIFTHSLPGFTNYFKTFYINKYEEICSIPNCYICNMR